MGVVMIYGSLNMQEITRGQGQPLLPQFFGGWIPAWGILTQPLEFPPHDLALASLATRTLASLREELGRPPAPSHVYGLI